MFKKYGVFATAVVFVLAAISIGQKTDQSEQTMMSNLVQPSASYRGDTARAHIVSHKFTIPNNRVFKGVLYSVGAGSNATISVHLINDAASAYTKMPVVAATTTWMLFNSVDSATSSCNWDSCTFWYVPNLQYDTKR